MTDEKSTCSSTCMVSRFSPAFLTVKELLACERNLDAETCASDNVHVGGDFRCRAVAVGE